MKGFKNLDDFRFRMSYALSGNAPRRDYTFYNTYSTYNTSYLGDNGVFPSSMELRNLRWETVHGGNIGFNISLFKQRVRADVDFYRNRTEDLFHVRARHQSLICRAHRLPCKSSD